MTDPTPTEATDTTPWGRVYSAVLGTLAFYIAAFWAITRWFG